MLHDTHVMIGLNTWDILSDKEKEIIIKKSFLNGNVLPDIHPTYRVRKHRLKQFENKICYKINYLSSLKYEDIGNEVNNKKFSRELGIICHFLSDFFCMPHSQWGVKESMTLKHVKYEKNLHKKVESFGNVTDVCDISKQDGYEEFLKSNLKKHRNKHIKKHHHENDLYYSMYMCNSVVKHILKQIDENSKA